MGSEKGIVEEEEEDMISEIETASSSSWFLAPKIFSNGWPRFMELGARTKFV
jgi:hypothetical protein